MKVPESLPIPRITMRRVGEEILEQFNLEKGFGYTIKVLFLTPGAAIQEYLFEERRRMMRPLPLVLLLTAVATFLSFHLLPLDAGLSKPVAQSVQSSGLPQEMVPLLELLQKMGKQYFNLILMSSIPFMAFTSFWLFRKSSLYYAEHVVINMYLFSAQTLLLILFLPVISIMPMIALFTLCITLIYFSYAFKLIFQVSWRESISKTILFILVSQVVQNLVVTLAALVIWGFFL